MSATRTIGRSVWPISITRDPLAKMNWRGNGYVDFVLMFLSVAEIAAPGLPVAVPLGELAIILLIAVSVFRPRLTSLRSASVWLLGATAILTYMLIVSVINETDWFRRLTRIVILLIFFYCVATGRVNLNMGIKGYLTGLILNVPLFYAGLAPDNYAGALTGYLVDKNVAGLVYGVATFIAMFLVRGGLARVTVFVIGMVAVFATGSRTTMAAMLLAAVWLVVAKRLNLFFKVTLFGFLLFLFYFLEENYARAAIFSDRWGSDLLRERIGEASLEKLATGPWYGYGLGQAFATVDDANWLFHDSYLALRAEGGWILLVAVICVYLATFYPLLRLSRFNVHSSTAVSAMIVVFFCALKLGEVFITPVGFLLMGICAYLSAALSPITTFDGRTKVQQKPSVKL
ncbi:hypothetical protein ACXA45_03610 [Neomicrococcus lactis]